MPYPNEHSARLENPNKYVRIRRENNKFGNGIHAIWGVLKNQKVELQAIRFSKNKFTIEQVRTWLKEHKFKPISLEKATNIKNDNPYKIRKQGEWFLIISVETGKVVGRSETREKAEASIRARMMSEAKKRRKDNMPKVVNRFDFSFIKESHIDESTGFLNVPARATRTGVFKYRLADGSVFRELRLPEEVFDTYSMKTLEGKPLTNNHPMELVRVKNAKKYMVGYTNGKVEIDGNWLTTQVIVTDEDTIKDIENGKQQLSCGYECQLEMKTGNFMGEEYDAIQRTIRYNHLAIVDSARAGIDARLNLDNADGELIDNNKNPIGDNIEIQYEEEEVKNMEIITINDVEYEVNPEIAKEIQRLKTKTEDSEKVITDLKKTKDETEAKMDALKSELENDKKKEKKEKMDKDEIKKAVKQRIRLITIAKKVCDEETIKKLDELEDIEIKKVIVKSKHDINLDEKSNDYIDAFVDAVETEIIKKDGTKELGETIMKGRKDGNETDIEKIREKSMKEDLELWKQPLKAV